MVSRAEWLDNARITVLITGSWIWDSEVRRSILPGAAASAGWLVGAVIGTLPLELSDAVMVHDQYALTDRLRQECLRLTVGLRPNPPLVQQHARHESADESEGEDGDRQYESNSIIDCHGAVPLGTCLPVSIRRATKRSSPSGQIP